MQKKKHPRLKRNAVYSTTKDGFTRNGKKVVVERRRAERQSKDSAASRPERYAS